MKNYILIASVFLLTACGHSQIRHTPEPSANMTIERAVSIVERGFYEDYANSKPQAVVISDDAIILSDGSVTTGSSFGSVIPNGYGGGVVAGNSVSKTVAAGQRIYLDSLQPSVIMKKNGRDNRFAVVIRIEPGITSRRIFFRSEQRAKEFADALEYLHRRHSVAQQ